MKIWIILLFIVIGYFNLDSKYSLIEICDKAIIDNELMDLIDHESIYFENDCWQIVADSSILELLEVRRLNFNVKIDDLEQYYVNRFDKSKLSYQIQDNPYFKFGTILGHFRHTEIFENFDKMKSLFPNIITLDTIGKSFENRDIIAYHFISTNNSKPKKNILINSLHHGREPGSATVLIYFLWDLLYNLQLGDENSKYILDNFNLVIVPIVNPDGYLHNEQTNPHGGGMWRKNRNNTHNGSPRDGVDLNRNYGPNDIWDMPISGSSIDPNSDVFRGRSEFSESETQAIRNLSKKIDFTLAINIHTFGHINIFPSTTGDFPKDNNHWYENFGLSIYKLNRMIYGKDLHTVGYSSRGTSDQYFYYGLEKPVYTFTPEFGTFDDAFWPSSINRIEIQCRSYLNLFYEALLSSDFNVNLNHIEYIRGDSIKLDLYCIGNGQLNDIQLRLYTIDNFELVDSSYFNNVELNSNFIHNIDLSKIPFNKNGFVLETKFDNYTKYDTLLIIRQSYIDIPIFNKGVFHSNYSRSQNLIWDLEYDSLRQNYVLSSNPYSNYPLNSNSSISFEVDLSNYSFDFIELSMLARWNIEVRHDLIATDYSFDSEKSMPLYFENFSIYKDTVLSIGKFLINETTGFYGHINRWNYMKANIAIVNEKISKLNFSFTLLSDNSRNFAGFYADLINLRLYSDTYSSIFKSINLSNALNISKLELVELLQDKEQFVEIFTLNGNKLYDSKIENSFNINQYESRFLLIYTSKNGNFEFYKCLF